MREHKDRSLVARVVKLNVFGVDANFFESGDVSGDGSHTRGRSNVTTNDHVNPGIATNVEGSFASAAFDLGRAAEEAFLANENAVNLIVGMSMTGVRRDAETSGHCDLICGRASFKQVRVVASSTIGNGHGDFIDEALLHSSKLHGIIFHEIQPDDFTTDILRDPERTEGEVLGSLNQKSAAVVEMRQAVRNLVVDPNSPEGRLFGLAKTIADELAKLHAAAKSGSKHDIIMCSRQIATLVSQVLAQAQEAAAKCTDRRLSETLLTQAQAAKNFAVQLKILTAVKAATAEEDPTVKALLVKCSKQLANSMIKAISAAEVTKLRSKK